MGEELQLDAKGQSPDFQHKLKLVLQGGLTQAQSDALAIEHMEYTKAAKEVRNARRRAQSKREVLGAQTLCKDLQGKVTLPWQARTSKEKYNTPLQSRRWDGVLSLAG